MTHLYVYRHRPAAGELSLFPTEHVAGPRFSNDEIIRQSRLFGRFYAEVVAALAPHVATGLGLSLPAARILTRIGSVPVLHAVIDRAIRLDRLAEGQEALFVAPAEPFATPPTIDRFCELAGKSHAFNQWLVSSVASLWGIPASDVPAVRPETVPLSSNDRGFVNYLFFVPNSGWSDRVRRRARLAWSSRVGPVPASGMANVLVPLADHGVYGRRGLAHLPDHLEYSDGRIDPFLRNQVFGPAAPVVIDAAERCCEAVGVRRERHLLAGHVAEFLQIMFPTSLFEAGHANLSSAKRLLGSFRGRAVITGSLGFGTQAAFLAAAGKELGREVIGMQHGGHYGYSEEHTGAFEGEYACADRFITWGWNQMPAHPAIAGQRAVPLPSPWLSERQRHWADLLSPADRRARDRVFDILLMPNKLYPFPPAPSGSHATVNHAPEFAEGLKRFVRVMRSAGLRVFHKPYNRLTCELLEDTERELERLGGDGYRRATTFDKGLTPELLRQCHVVVWDQPGTGFLECLTADIPNLVLWPRLFNRETPQAEAIFRELELVGIVHRDPETMVPAIQQIKDNPTAWIEEPRRAEVVARFCATYARTAPDWARDWREFVRGLA